MRSMRRIVSVGILSLVLLGGCKQAPVTVAGVPVDHPATTVAVNAVQRAETVSVAIGTWMIGARREACHGVALEVLPLPEPCRTATNILTVYATTMTPAVLTAITGARNGILAVEAADTPAARTTLDLALVALQQALTTAQTYAQAHGYK